MGDNWFFALLAIIAVIIAAVVAVILFGSVGILYGSGVSMVNYGKSFSKNVYREKITV